MSRFEKTQLTLAHPLKSLSVACNAKRASGHGCAVKINMLRKKERMRERKREGRETKRGVQEMSVQILTFLGGTVCIWSV